MARSSFKSIFINNIFDDDSPKIAAYHLTLNRTTAPQYAELCRRMRLVQALLDDFLCLAAQSLLGSSHKFEKILRPRYARFRNAYS